MSVTQFYPSGLTSGLTGPSLGIMTVQGRLETLDLYSPRIGAVSGTGFIFTGSTGPLGIGSDCDHFKWWGCVW